jgi:hypothetical protein
MATQVLQIELTEAIDPIAVKDGYKYGRVLVRRSKIPVGWVSLSYQNKQVITADEIVAAVKKQLGLVSSKKFSQSRKREC